MFPANLWYAAAFAADGLPTQPFAAQVAGEAVVLYRRSDGGTAALADRCCHRAAPLSLGRVEGDALRCLYHGLKFDAQGRCIEIPGQTQIPKSACVKSYAVAEADGWIWLWIGDPAKADPAALPKTELEREGWHHRQGFLDYDANFHLINDNLTDFSHVAYVHAATFGRGAQAWAHELPKVTQLDHGVLVQRWVTDAEPQAAPLHASYTAQAVTPLDDKRSRYFFRVANRLQDDHDGLDLNFGISQRAFAEDKRMIEAQQRMIDAQPSPAFVSTLHDAGLIRFRRLLDARLPVRDRHAA